MTSGLIESIRAPRGGNLRLMLLSLALAACVWAITAASRTVETRLTPALRLENIPRGFSVDNRIPARLEVTISGPLAVVTTVRRTTSELVVDLTGAGTTGAITISHPEILLRLPGEITVTRVSPDPLIIHLQKNSIPQGEHQ